MLEFFVDTGYSIVEHSWMVSTVLVKYIVAAQLSSVLVSEGFDDLSFDSFREALLVYSAPTVLLIVLSGSAAYLAGFMAEPLFLPVLSEFLAWLYFGYLFWEF